MKDEMADWRTFYKDGQSYHRTAQGSVKRPEVFTPEIIYNLIAMSIEKYFMAIFMFKGMLPRNHTMRDLVEEAKEHFTVDGALEEILIYMDHLQEICSLDAYKVTPPKPEDIPKFMAALDSVAKMAQDMLPVSEDEVTPP